MLDVCTFCRSPLEDHVSHDAPFLMFTCGTRRWRKGCFHRDVQSPECIHKALAIAEQSVEHFQNEHRPQLSGERG